MVSITHQLLYNYFQNNDNYEVKNNYLSKNDMYN